MYERFLSCHFTQLKKDYLLPWDTLCMVMLRHKNSDKNITNFGWQAGKKKKTLYSLTFPNGLQTPEISWFLDFMANPNWNLQLWRLRQAKKAFQLHSFPWLGAGIFRLFCVRSRMRHPAHSLVLVLVASLASTSKYLFFSSPLRVSFLVTHQTTPLSF